jgi:hypothetical protein
MSDVLELEAPGVGVDGKARLRLVRDGDEVDLLFSAQHMREAHPGARGTNAAKNHMAQEPQTTLIHIYVKHAKPLPPDILDKLAGLAYMEVTKSGDRGDAVAQFPEFPTREWEVK